MYEHYQIILSLKMTLNLYGIDFIKKKEEEAYDKLKLRSRY